MKGVHEMMTGDGMDRTAELETGSAPGPGNGGAEVSPDPFHLAAEDRDRLAHDLSDTLVRKMFTVSLDLHAALSRIEHGTGDGHAAEKIRHAIVGLDQAIDDIRNGVFVGGRPGRSPRHDR